MNRREEIEKAARIEYEKNDSITLACSDDLPDLHADFFIAGAEWADLNPINRIFSTLEIESLQSQLSLAEKKLEIAVEAMNKVKNNGAKADDLRWNVINEALSEINAITDQKREGE